MHALALLSCYPQAVNDHILRRTTAAEAPPAAAAAADAALAAPFAAEAAAAAAAAPPPPPPPPEAAEAAAAPCKSLRDRVGPSLMSQSAPESKRSRGGRVVNADRSRQSGLCARLLT